MNTSSSISTLSASRSIGPGIAITVFAMLLWLGYSSWLEPNQRSRQLATINGDLAVQLEAMQPVDRASLAHLLDSTHYFAQLDTISLSFADPALPALSLRNRETGPTIQASRTVLLRSGDSAEPRPARLTVGVARQSIITHPVTLILGGLLVTLVIMVLRQRLAGDDDAAMLVAAREPQPDIELPPSTPTTAAAQTLAETELALARRSALEASRLKSELIANTSHELLTPLNSIVGYATLLEKTTGLSPLQQEFVRKISNSGQHLSALTNDLLDFALHGNRNLRLKYQSCDVGDLLQSCCEVLSIDAHNKHLALLTDFDTLAGLRVQTDPVRLRQIVSNLLVNAIRYTQAGHVLVAGQLHSLQDSHSQLEITISDTGEGMPPELREQVFSALVKTDQLTEQVTGPGQGLGLGLAIVNGIVTQMGGSIDLQSQLQVGSSFKITLPVAQFEATDVTAYPQQERFLVYSATPAAADNLAHRLHDYARQVDTVSSIPAALEQAAGCERLFIDLGEADRDWASDDTHRWSQALASLDSTVCILRPVSLTPATRLAELSLASPAALATLLCSPAIAAGRAQNRVTPVAGSRRALVVDDNPSNLEVLALMLDDLGVHADTANNADAALGKLTATDYDYLFIDLKMQPVNGMELLAMLRQQALQPRATVVACTAHSSDAEFRNMFDAGFEQVLHKPVDIDVLAQLLSDKRNKAAAVTAKPTKPATFDTAYALARSVNRPALAHSNLLRLLDELEQLLNGHSELDSDREQAILQVHYVNGSAAMTGARAIKASLDQLESALKAPVASPGLLERSWRELAGQHQALQRWYQEHGDAFHADGKIES